MIVRILTILLFVVTLLGIIGYSRGYRLDISNTALTSTGLVAVTSTPRSAKVYVNNELKGITDLSLNLEPGTYTFTVIKDGYFPWQKTITLKGEIVQSLDAILYPVNSSLNPLTNIGVVSAIPIDQVGGKTLILSDKIEDTVSTPIVSPTGGAQERQQGIFVYDPTQRVVSFLPNLQKIIDYDRLGPNIDPRTLAIAFSPDLKQMIVFITSADTSELDLTPTITPTVNTLLASQNQLYPHYVVPETFASAFLVTLDSLNTDPLNVTDSALSLIEAWTEKKAQTLITYTNSLEKPLGDFIKDTTRILDISTDETRVLYEATAAATLAPVLEQPLIGTNQTSEVRSTTEGDIYLYDIKEDKNYQLMTKDEALGRPFPLIHPNSKNIVTVENKSISISDFDGKNKHKVYSGPFESSFYAVTLDGRVVVLTNLNPELHTYGDLYAVGVR